MNQPIPPRDYSLLGADARRAVDTGLATAEWYHTDLPRREMKAFMRREDGPAVRDTLILFGAMLLLALGGIATWGSWWAVPFWLGYGVLYGSAMDSRWHECGHGTAFRTPWMNDLLYQVASFMMVRNPVSWRWSHARHHTDTIIVGRDPEIVAMRPANVARMLGNFFGLHDAAHGWWRMLVNASGRLDAEEATYIPESEQPKVVRIARVWCLIYAATILLAIAAGSWLPLMIVGLPRLYGAWHHVMTGILQHAGLDENVLDHRLNSRTVYMNPLSRFVYWNMNYHVEHHMFPMVPYHRLPELHERLKDDLPAPNRSIVEAYREVIGALRAQRRDLSHRLERTLPPTAQPYRLDLHAAALGDAAGGAAPGSVGSAGADASDAPDPRSRATAA